MRHKQCCWGYLQNNMAVVDAPLCPSDNDPHTYYSAPPAVYFGSTTYHSFPPKRNTLVSTHVHCSFTQFSWENTVQATAWKHEWKRAWVMHKTLRWTICTYAFGVYLISADSLLRCCSALLCSVLEPVAGNYMHTAPSMLLRAQMLSLGVFTWAKQLFVNELKLKMAVDARRKWLPREKVMPGKPGGDDGDAHTADQSESSPSRPSTPPPPPSSGPEQPCHPWASAGYGKGLCALGMSHWGSRFLILWSWWLL